MNQDTIDTFMEHLFSIETEDALNILKTLESLSEELHKILFEIETGDECSEISKDLILSRIKSDLLMKQIEHIDEYIRTFNNHY
jgi:hypothetical protein